MRDYETGLTQARLKELLSYDAESGMFTRKQTRGAAIAGTKVEYKFACGYIGVRLDGFLYYAHRLVWLYVYNSWPREELDHINRIRTDNRLVNLREATSTENKRNHGIYTHNTSGVSGVTWCKRTGKWQAQLQHKGKHIHLGRHIRKEDAIKARKEGELLYFRSNAI